jgi:mannose-6-phosphate isomerase-like protein (cupin superfamily)
MKRFFSLTELQAERAASGKRYLEFLRVPALSTGIYVLSKEALDQQTPHQQDEIYYVVSGRARLKITRNDLTQNDQAPNDQTPSDHASEDRPVAGGSVIFVEAGAAHRFHSIEEDLIVLVVFGPAEA